MKCIQTILANWGYQEETGRRVKNFDAYSSKHFSPQQTAGFRHLLSDVTKMTEIHKVIF
jgi:hypothetical protein